jgi:alpha-glucosidase
MRHLIGFLFLMMIFLQSCNEKSFKSITINSPNEQVSLNLSFENELLKYHLDWKGERMLNQSVLSFFKDKQFTITAVFSHSKKEEWQPVWGQFSNIQDHYNETVIHLEVEGVEGKLLCRAYDQGVAFRYIFEKNEKIKQSTYRCEFNLTKGSKIYYPNGEKEPIGPIAVQEAKGKIKWPVIVEHPSGKSLSLMESDLYSAAGFKVMNVEKTKNLLFSSNQVTTTSGAITSPWRVILLEEKTGDLVLNTVPINLAAPNKLKDAAWIKPGKTLWDWRVHGYIAPDGFKYGINTESYLRFIDFAAANDIEYFLIDDAWYTHVSKGHIEHSKKLDLTKVSQYAKEKGVDLILYYDRRHGTYGDEALFKHYQTLGMKGIKYGFMKDNVPFTRNAIALSAESHLIIDFHDGPVPFTGIRRTFPNALTREYCHAQQDSRRAFTPESFIKMAMINAVQGPLDMNNGNFDITGISSGKREKGPRKKGSYLSTVTAEAARTLIIFSGLVCIPDAPEAYEAKLDLFEFIQKQPVGKWDESKILHAQFNEYISTARRHDNQWFIGSVASQKGATLNIELDFLQEGIEYQANLYEDTAETHCQTNPEAYQIRKIKVKKGDIIEAKMASGGGHCIWIRP